MSTTKEVIGREEKFLSRAQKIPYYPVAFEKGEGAVLYGFDGKEYIDFLSSASSSNLGHGNEEIAEAVHKQMLDLAQYTSAYFPGKTSALLAEKLSWTTGMENIKVAFAATGSASIDGAIKIARAYTKRTKLISFIGAYHGSTYGALSLSALSLNMRRDIGPTLPEVYHFEYPNCMRCRFGCKEESCSLECVKNMKDAFSSYLPPEEVAAVFFEPIAGDAGLVIPPVKFVKALRELCDDNGILLVADEIQQGLCRTGKYFSLDNFGVKADLYVLGKSLGAGLPLGAVIGKREIMDALSSPGHLFTLGSNAAVAAAALKGLEICERDNLNEESVKKGAYLKEKLERLAEKYDIIGDVRGVGLSIGVELVTDKKTMGKNYDAASKISYRCIESGLVLIFLGQNVLRVQPPLVITYEQMDKAVDIIDRIMGEYISGSIGDEVYEYMKGW